MLGTTTATKGTDRTRNHGAISIPGASRGAWRLGLRVLGAALLFASAAIHLDLYVTGYRTIPTIGALFLLQMISAFALGVVVLLTGGRVVSAGGAGLAISTLAGKLLASFGDRIEPRYIWAGAMVAFGLGMILVVHATSAADLYPFPILLGFGWGATLVSMMGAPMNYFGLKAYPAVIGLWLALQTGIGSVAPFVAGYVFDKYGSYTPVFYSIAGLCFVGSMLLLLATPPRRKVADEARTAHPALGQSPARA